jgi:hypothetical protein
MPQLEVATAATQISAEHEFNEHSTQAGGESDIQSVLSEAESPALKETQILIRERKPVSGLQAWLGTAFQLAQHLETFSKERFCHRRIPDLAAPLQGSEI